MHAHENASVESNFEILQRLAKDVLVFARVDLHVVARGFDPVDFVSGEESDAACVADDDAIELGAVTTKGLEQTHDLLAEVPVGAAEHVLPRPSKCLLKPGSIEGLEQVIERVHLKGLERVFVVGSDKD